MRAKGTLLALLAGGLLILAPSFDGARADDRTNQQHWQSQSHGKKSYSHGQTSQYYFGNKWHGGNHTQGQHSRPQAAYKLSKQDRKALKRMRQRFQSEQAFRRHLRQHKPRLYASYMGQFQQHQQHYDGRNQGRYDGRQHRVPRNIGNYRYGAQGYVLPPQGRVGN